MTETTMKEIALRGFGFTPDQVARFFALERAGPAMRLAAKAGYDPSIALPRELIPNACVLPRGFAQDRLARRSAPGEGRGPTVLTATLERPDTLGRSRLTAASFQGTGGGGSPPAAYQAPSCTAVPHSKGTAAPDQSPARAEQLTQAIYRERARGTDSLTRDDLTAMGFTPAEVERYGADAVAQAARRWDSNRESHHA